MNLIKKKEIEKRVLIIRKYSTIRNNNRNNNNYIIQGDSYSKSPLD